MTATTCSPTRPSYRSERGISIITVAVSLLALMALSALVLDYGVLWLGRRQAQNAADAGALAGVITRAFDERSAAGPLTTASATNAALSNKVVGESGAVAVNTGPCPAWAPGGVTDNCVQVDVFRDGAHGNPLPTYFANIWNQTSQDIKAHAIAEVMHATGTTCMKPWMAPDKSSTDTYDVGDIGTLLILRYDVSPATYQQADFASTPGTTCQGGGAACYSWATLHCAGGPSGGSLKEGDPVNAKPGNTAGKQEADAIYQQDPNAEWDPVKKEIIKSCAPNSCACAADNSCANGLGGRVSPRLLAVGLFDPVLLATLKNGSLPIKNIGGFFILEPGVGDPKNPSLTLDCIGKKNNENLCGYLDSFPGTGFSAGGSAKLNVIPMLIQ